MDIIEYNKKCAEFLGGVYERYEKLSFEPKGRWFIKQFPDALQDHNLKFHSDWNWIMEVVKKIWVISEEIDGNYQKDSEYYDHFYALNFHKMYLFTPKEVVLESINDFLNWYNINK
jgi:hypothetical protein